MKQDKHKTEMLFRVDKYGVFAVMPYEVEKNGYVTIYQHLGQHSTGQYFHIISNSRPAQKKDIRPLFDELTNRGYNIKIIKRINYSRFLKAFNMHKNEFSDLYNFNGV